MLGLGFVGCSPSPQYTHRHFILVVSAIQAIGCSNCKLYVDSLAEKTDKKESP